MSTAITATKIAGPYALGPDYKVAVYKVAFPDSWTLAGVSIDLSDSMDYVTGYIVGCSGAVADHARKYDLIGTYTSSGLATSAISLVSHQSAASAGVLPGTPNATNLSSVDDLYLIVFGN